MLDPFVRDSQERSAREVLRDRISPPNDLGEAFEELMARVESEYWNGGHCPLTFRRNLHTAISPMERAFGR